jgi:signal transduction histidine kinase
MDTYQFSVDTKLFRELGELLVGRESIALAELIKNAYDADATEVRVYGEELDDPERGLIQISDDGIGMSDEEFRNGFLRIAGRSRTSGDLRSRRFKRRYTGAKGVGRLAAHKLATLLEIRSWKWNGRVSKSGLLSADEPGIDATIDWNLVESFETLDEIGGTAALRVDQVKGSGVAGTEITLRRPRRRWTKVQLKQFHSEALTLVPLDILSAPTSRAFGGKLLFTTPKIRDVEEGSFSLSLQGSLKPDEELLAGIPESAALLIEVDCSAARGTVRFGVAPSERFASEFPGASRETYEVPYQKAVPDDASEVALSFHARIFERTPTLGGWPPYAQGIRVYMEGFRVPPYGESTDDWLGINSDYSIRGKRTASRLDTLAQYLPPGDPREGLVIRPTQTYSGAVFLRNDSAPGLEMLVNREGFLPGPSLDALSHIVRVGVDIATRLRYASTEPVQRARKEAAEEIRTGVADGNPRQMPSWHVLGSRLDEIAGTVHSAREAIAGNQYQQAASLMTQAERRVELAREFPTEQSHEAAMLRVLASLGTQLAAFHHEIASLVTTAEALVERLDALRLSGGLTQKQERLLAKAIESAEGLRRGIDRQAVYLIDVTSIDARRRRSRQSLSERFSAACRLLGSSIEKRQVSIENEVPEDWKTPAMFPAEITMVLTNLLSNAVKFAGHKGRVRIVGEEKDDALVFRMENTGQAVKLAASERWFDPFRTTTANVDATLGQGMGLGLTITRSILDEYGAEIKFVAPSRQFATAVEVRFPRK